MPMALTLKDRLARQASGDVHFTFDPAGRDEPHLISLSLGLIDTDPNQPRKDLGQLADLALSIREHGVVQPLIVEAVDGGRYRLVAGERRLAACRSLGLETAPCLVRMVAEQSRLALQLIENLHRKNLNPIEEARAFQHLIDEFGLTQRNLALRVGKSVSSISETLRILDLSPELLAEVRTSEIASRSVLLEIAKETDPERQRELWVQAQAGQLTVRKARTTKRESPTKVNHSVARKIEINEATVVVRFMSGEASRERVTAALQQALAAEQVQS